MNWVRRFGRAGLDGLGLASGPEEFHRNVRRVALARLISQAGSQAANVALIALVYERTNGSGIWLAAVFLSSFVVVRVILSPLMGLIGDHFDRRVVMIVSDLAAAAAFVGLAFAHRPVVLLALSVCAAIAEAPFGPTANAQLLMMVPEEMQTWATSVRSTAWWTGLLIGGIGGGALVALVGAPMTFLINAVTFVVSVSLVFRLSGGPFRAERSTKPEHRGIWAGVRFVSTQPALRFSSAAVCLGLLGGGMMNVAEYPLMVKLGGGSIAYGVAIALWGTGGVLGGRNARRKRDAYQERGVLIRGWLVFAVAMIACVVPFTPVVILLFGAGGFGYAAGVAASNLIQQRWTPDPIRARVFAAVDSLNGTALGISLAIGGVTLSTIGPVGVFILGGSITLAGVFTARYVPPRERPIDNGAAPTTSGAVVEDRTKRTLVSLPMPA